LDEAGIGRPADEPITVVAGVVLHADRQWKALEQYLRDMADEFSAPVRRRGFVFHAKEIFHGNGRFPREEYPDPEVRWRILDELVQIPRKFDMPVVLGAIQRNKVRNPPGADAATRAVLSHTMAYATCASVIERYMREGAAENEVASLVVENNQQARQAIYEVHNLLRDPHRIEEIAEMVGNLNDLWPFQRIVEAPLFAEKTDSSPLQVADACAFVIARHLKNAANAERFYAALRDNIIALPNWAPDVSTGRLS
jgi:hypothetical protein